MTTRLLSLVLTLSLLQLSAAAEVTLTGDSSEPAHSLFIPGQEVILKFRAVGLPEDTKESLTVKITDEQGASVRDYTLPLAPLTNKTARIRYSDDEGNGKFLWKVDLYPPTNRLGYFQVSATLSSGEELPEVCSRPAGFMTYAIIPDPSQRMSYPARETFFGMMGPVEPALMGASWYVLNYGMFTWNAFEPERAGQFEETVKKFEAEGAKVSWAGMPHFEGKYYFNIAGKAGSIPVYNILHIGSPPWWAAKNETRGHLAAALTRPAEPAFREFCLKLGRYMAEHHGDEAVHYYQVTAEPEIPWGYKGTIEDLVRLYEIAYPALHEADSNAVVTGPTVSIGSHQVRELFEKGLGQYIDVLDFHPYMGGDVLPSEFDLVGKIREAKQLMREYLGKELPMAGTESGYSNDGESHDLRLRKALSDVQHNLILLGEGFWLNVVFHGNDMGRKANAGGWGYFFNLDPDNDFAVRKASPRPVAPAYAAMSFLLEGHKTAGPIEWMGDDVVGYAYERSNDVILALWSDVPTDVQFPVGVPQVKVFDWMGNPTVVRCTNGVLALSLAREPHYVKGVSPALWSRKGKGKPITIKTAQLTAVPGGTVSVACRLAGTLAAPIKGQLTLTPALDLEVEPITRAVTVGKGSAAEELFTFELPPTAKPGMHSLAFTLVDKGIPVGGAGLTLTVEPAIQITRVAPTLSANGCGLAITLRGEAREGQLEVVPTETTHAPRTNAFALKPGQTRTYSVLWKDSPPQPFPLEADITATAVQGSVATNHCRFEVAAATRLTTTPTIDGSLADWADVTPLTLGEASLIDGTNEWKGAEDLSATLRLGWDTQALYIACEVVDDLHYQHSKELAYMPVDDSLSLAINLDPHNAAVAGSQNVESGVLRRWHELVLAMRDDGPNWVKAGRLGSYDLRFAPAGELSAEQLPLAVVREGTATRYEAAIPWTFLNADKKVATDTTIGLALVVRDVEKIDGKKESAAVGLFGGLHPVRDIPKYGWLILTGGK